MASSTSEPFVTNGSQTETKDEKSTGKENNVERGAGQNNMEDAEGGEERESGDEDMSEEGSTSEDEENDECKEDNRNEEEDEKGIEDEEEEGDVEGEDDEGEDGEGEDAEGNDVEEDDVAGEDSEREQDGEGGEDGDKENEDDEDSNASTNSSSSSSSSSSSNSDDEDRIPIHRKPRSKRDAMRLQSKREHYVKRRTLADIVRICYGLEEELEDNISVVVIAKEKNRSKYVYKYGGVGALQEQLEERRPFTLPKLDATKHKISKSKAFDGWKPAKKRKIKGEM